MPIPPQILYPLITGGVNLATQLATKPKKQKSPIDYMNKYIANLRSDIGKRETYHTMMRSNLGAIGKATSAQRREAKYLGELKGTGGGILSAEMQRIQQGQNEAISRASGQAEQAQRRETAGLQASLREAEMMREQIVQRTREANRVQDQQWQQGLIQTGLQTVGQVGAGAIKYSEAQKLNSQQQAQFDALVKSGMYEGDATQQMVDTKQITAKQGIDNLKMLGKKKDITGKETTQTQDVYIGDGMVQKYLYNAETDRYDIEMGEPFSKYQPKDDDSKDGIPETKSNIDRTMANKLPELIKNQKEMVQILLEKKEEWADNPARVNAYNNANEELNRLEGLLQKDKFTARVGETEDEFMERLIEYGNDKESAVLIFEKSFAKSQSKKETEKRFNRLLKEKMESFKLNSFEDRLYNTGNANKFGNIGNTGGVYSG